MTNQSRKLASLLRPANLGAQADPSASVVKNSALAEAENPH